MSEEEKKSSWDKYKGKTVVVQLRTQPYIGITSENLIPATSEEGFLNTPLIRGSVVEVSGNRMVLQTTDPDPNLSENKVFIDLDAERDVGYLTTIERPRIRTV